MTYVNKKTRLFLDRGDVKPERRRSEARLKTYPSAIDIRAWCGIVEDRRQHILELVTKTGKKCLGSLIPLEAIIDAVLAGRIADMKKLRQCLTQLWKFIEGATLNDEDRNKLTIMMEKMDPICTSKDGDGDSSNESIHECVAKARHLKELEEVNSLVKSDSELGGSYRVTARGPAKIITRIKGIRPGLKTGASPGSASIRSHDSARVNTTVANAFSNLKEKDKTRIPDDSQEQYPDQSFQEQSPRQTDQILPEDLSSGHSLSQSSSVKQSPDQSSKRRSPRQTPSRKAHLSPTSRSIEQTPQGQTSEPSPKSQAKKRTASPTPRDQQSAQPQRQRESSPKSPKGQSAGKSPLRTPPKTPQGARELEQLEEPYQKQSQGGLQRVLFQDTTHERQIQRSPRVTQLGDSPPSAAFTPLMNSSMVEGSQLSPRTNLDATSPEDIRIQLQARETLCNELQVTLANITKERDDMRKKFQTTLEELDALKKLNAASPVVPTSCKEEIEALELEIKVMRSGSLSPEQEAEVIKKEVDVLKKYCMKLKFVEDENEKLKIERDTLKSQVTLSDETGNEKPKSLKDNLNRQHKIKVDRSKDAMETLDNVDFSKAANMDDKFKNLEDITKERDMLANKVQRLEKELLQYRDLPEDIDVYRNRSKMLDSALEERDKMSKKVEQLKEMEDELNQLRKRSSRVDELEEELKTFSKNDKNIGSELKKATSRCTCLEKELENVKMERDSMRTRIEYMKKEIDMLRAKSKEAEIYKVERDKLQLRVTELSHIQVQYENLLLKCKCLEHAAAEKEMYKQKYEEVISMECQGDMLRSQIEATRGLERERNALVKQVGDLESCICDQEEEIKKLMTQIDCLCRNKDDNQCRMREALASMRAEIEKKDCLIAESEEKLAAVQTQLKSSIQGVSCETTCYKTRIEDLQRELNKAQLQIETLKKQLNKNDSCFKGVEKITKSECESVATMKRELEAAKEENRKLRDIANKMATLTGDEHVQNMLKQSQCAVKRVVEELGRQYKEWDNMKRNHKKGIFAEVNKRCPCKYKHVDPHRHSDSENEKLVEELEDIQREKDKLEQIVKQIQNDKFGDNPQNELLVLRADKVKLQEQLQRETEKRKDLEKKLKMIA